MSRYFRLIAVLLPALVAVGNAQAPTNVPLVVHEWGTFTSIAGSDGQAVEWLPLSGPSDLPCFVNRSAFNLKGTLPGTVRMETPVLYFYGPSGAVVDVSVRFKQGVVTEWFPPAAVSPSSQAVSTASLLNPGFASGITWKHVTLQSNSRDGFPQETDASHYYAARLTDALSLQSDASREKFLFYRGIGGFQPPVRASLAPNGQVVVRSSNGETFGDVVLFDNHRGTMAYQVQSGVKDRVTLDSPSLDGEFVPPTAELEQILISRGLYGKEAKAMVETWRDSWFEEGTRVFYIAPRSTIDALLPLDINPTPSDIVRVFVGRVELATPSRLEEVKKALLDRDLSTLRLYGRYLEPMAKRILGDTTTPAERFVMSQSLSQIVNSSTPSARTCK